MTAALTPDGAPDPAVARAVADAMLATPFLAGLGASFERFDPDDVLLRLPFREDLTNDGERYHGGVVATALDTAGAGAAWSAHDLSRGVRGATVAMTVQYLAAARRSDLWCHGRTARRARELVFTEVSATDDAGRMVAHAVQTYRIA